MKNNTSINKLARCKRLDYSQLENAYFNNQSDFTLRQFLVCSHVGTSVRVLGVYHDLTAAHEHYWDLQQKNIPCQILSRYCEDYLIKL